MGVKRKVLKDDFYRVEKNLTELNGKAVNVGVLGGGEQAWLAGIHEYGCSIRVTPKMRAWFHHQGIHLKASTTEIRIPERSFLRAGFDKHHKEVLDKTSKAQDAVLSGKMRADAYCKLIGVMLSTKIKDYAVDLKNPPNSQFTIDRKGSSNPLVDTGDMIGAITYEVEG